jgi:hypothetical protein
LTPLLDFSLVATREITLKKFLTGLFSRQWRSMSKLAVRFKHSASHRG